MSALTWGGTLLTEPLSAGTRHRMRLVNVCVGVVLGAEGVLMLMLTGSLSLPVTASFLRNNPVAVAAGDDGRPAAGRRPGRAPLV